MNAMRFLIADDDIIAQKLLKKILSPFGHCDIVPDGQQAVDLFKQKWTENISYNLVIMDFAMPSIHGIEALKRIRTFEQENGQGEDQVPIIILSAHDNPAVISESYHQQTTAFIAKPINQEKLITELTHLKIIPSTI